MLFVYFSSSLNVLIHSLYFFLILNPYATYKITIYQETMCVILGKEIVYPYMSEGVCDLRIGLTRFVSIYLACQIFLNHFLHYYLSLSHY